MPRRHRPLAMPHGQHSPGAARRMLREFLDRVEGGERFVEVGELLISELVTNAVRPASQDAQLLRLVLAAGADRLQFSAEDASDAPPQMAVATDGESGRGLLLVDRLPETWGWDPENGGGKRVWCVRAPGSGGA
ncbi:ATP-binding protein [Kitasatospora acidiphila]|uniref:ATP-binding protein n=1 Tax=Kitasatospora acidiphila TaxID=2567942 RepID=UPI003C71D562